MNRLDFTFAGKLVSFESASMSDEDYDRLISRVGEDEAIGIRRQIEAALVLTFEVNRVWKGQVGTPFLVRYNTSRPCTKTPPMSIGNSYIVFGSHGPQSDSLMYFLTGQNAELAEPKLERGY